MFNCLKNKGLLICSIISCITLANMNIVNAQAGAILNHFMQQQQYEQFDRSLINPVVDQSNEPVITIQKTKATIITPEDKAAIEEVKKNYKSGDFQDVIAISNKTLSRNPDIMDLVLYRGGANYHLDNYNSALADAETYLVFNPGNTKALLLRSAANLMLKDYKQSIKDCEAVLKKEKNEKAYIVCGFNYALTNKNIKKALKYSDKVLKIDPDSEGGLLVKGIALLDSGRIEESLAVSNKLLAKDPLNSHGYTVRGFARYEDKNYAKAQEDAAIGIKFAPENPYNYLLLGKIYQQKNDKDESLTAYTKAKSLFYKNGNPKKAKETEKLINKLY